MTVASGWTMIESSPSLLEQHWRAFWDAPGDRKEWVKVKKRWKAMGVEEDGGSS